MGDALRAVGVPHAFYKQEKLFDTIEAREVLDLLRAIADPDDVTARGRAFITPFFGLSLTDLAACDDLDGSHALLRLLYEWRALAEAGDFETLFARVVDDSGIVCREVFWNPSERVADQLPAPARAAAGGGGPHAGPPSASWPRRWAPTSTAPAARPGDARDLQRLETDADAVQIMTIHHAKGLEAEVVFLYGGLLAGPGLRRADVPRRGGPAGGAGGAAARRPSGIATRPSRATRSGGCCTWRSRAPGGASTCPASRPAFRQLRGCYRFINERLDELFGGFTPPEVRALFQRVPVSCPEEALPALAPRRPRGGGGLEPARRSRWPAARRGAAGLRPRWRPARAGFLVTSYSAVKRLHPGVRAAAPGDEANDATADEAGGDEAARRAARRRAAARPRSPVASCTRCSRSSPLEPLAGQPPPPVATGRPGPEVEALFERKRQRHDRSPTHLPHAPRAGPRGAHRPAGPGRGGRRPAWRASSRALREVEFFYPIPERAHPLLAAEPQPAERADGRRFRIERGVVKGYIDLLFEHEGRTYVCDWKGDWLPDWDAGPPGRPLRSALRHPGRALHPGHPASASASTDRGGLRGSASGACSSASCAACAAAGDGAARGVHFQRPSWDEVLAWQRKMLGSGFWGLS